MGLDIVLGLVILSSAIRGWMRGFVLQAIRLAGLVGCIFAADPVRDYARPYVEKHLTQLRPELLDRLLWWGSAVATYVVATGVATIAVKMYRKRTFSLEDASRTDQFAGFFLGGLKGFVFACFVVAGLQRFAIDRVKGIDWAEEQARTSQAMVWDAQYHPAEKIWTAPPVQRLLTQVREHGLRPSTTTGGTAPEAGPTQKEDAAPVAVGNHPPRLGLPDPASSNLKQDFDSLLGELDKLKGR